jgi:hypothetical protein
MLRNEVKALKEKISGSRSNFLNIPGSLQIIENGFESKSLSQLR